MSGAKNQCMGCQAGWPLNEHGAHVTNPPGREWEFGDEMVSCTAARYGARPAPPRFVRAVVARCPNCGGWTAWHARVDSPEVEVLAAECRSTGDSVSVEDVPGGDLGKSCDDAWGKPDPRRRRCALDGGSLHGLLLSL